MDFEKTNLFLWTKYVKLNIWCNKQNILLTYMSSTTLQLIFADIVYSHWLFSSHTNSRGFILFFLFRKNRFCFLTFSFCMRFTSQYITQQCELFFFSVCFRSLVNIFFLKPLQSSQQILLLTHSCYDFLWMIWLIAWQGSTQTWKN